MKNLTFEQNKNKILENSISIFTDPNSVNVRIDNEEVMTFLRRMSSMFNDIKEEHTNSQDGLRNTLHLYGCELPIVKAVSDYGDATKMIPVIEERFTSIQAIK